LEAEHDNLRTALAWSRSRSDAGELGLRLAGALMWFWNLRGYRGEGQAWLKGMLAQTTTSAPTRARAKALFSLALFVYLQGDEAQAQSLLEESKAISHEIKDERGVAQSLALLAWIARDKDDQFDAARTFGEESVAIFRALGDKSGLALALDCLGTVLVRRDLAQAVVLFEESAALFRELGEKLMLGLALMNVAFVMTEQGNYRRAATLLEESLAGYRELRATPAICDTLYVQAMVARRQGEYGRAQALLKESLALWREIEDIRGLALFVLGMAGIAAAQGQAMRAACLCGAVEALREAAGAPLTGFYRIDCQRIADTARTHLDEATFAAAWAEGRAMSLEQAIAYALEADSPPEQGLRPAPSSPARVSPPLV
jgi:non-specific serine/threonine protein kinase